MPGRYTSTLRWVDVPPDQRLTAAADVRVLLKLAQPKDRSSAIEAEILRPIFRESVRRWQQSERPTTCPMATRSWYDKHLRVWMYRPCALTPRASGYCWRHEEAGSR